MSKTHRHKIEAKVRLGLIKDNTPKKVKGAKNPIPEKKVGTKIIKTHEEDAGSRPMIVGNWPSQMPINGKSQTPQQSSSDLKSGQPMLPHENRSYVKNPSRVDSKFLGRGMTPGHTRFTHR